MTSEVCLMNQQAVVLGADSALTMSRPEIESQYQTGADKIFVLNEKGPIAAMFCGNANFGPVPWSIVFQEVQNRLPNDAVEVANVRNLLLEFLADLNANSKINASNDWEIYYFYKFVEAAIFRFGRFLARDNWSRGAELTPAMVTSAMTRFRKYLDRIEVSKSKPGQNFAVFLKDHLGEALSQALGSQLGDTAFPEDCVKPLGELVLDFLLLEFIPYELKKRTSQIVVSGFGEKTLTPSMFSLEILCSFGGIVKFEHIHDDEIKNDFRNTTHFTSYAQDGAIKAMIFGVTPSFEESLEYTFNDAISIRFSKWKNELDISKQSNLSWLSDDMDYVSGKLLSDVIKYLKKEISDDHESAYQKILTQIDAANSKNLTSIAGQLMNLVITESALAQNRGVSGPIKLVTLTRGNINRSEIEGSR